MFEKPSEIQNQELVESSEKNVKELYEKLESIFLSRWVAQVESGGSGFSNLEEYEKLIKSGPAALGEIYRKLKEGKFELWIDLPENAYNDFIQTGKLKNVFETQSNSFIAGTGRKERYISTREVAEANMLGLSLVEYEKIPFDIRPKYGWLSEGGKKRVLKIGKTDDGDMYGKHTVILDAKKYFGKATVTLGDSLGVFAIAPSNSWSRCAIPLEYAWVLAPFFYDSNERTGEKNFLGKVNATLSSILKYDEGNGLDSGLKPNFTPPIADRLKTHIQGERGNDLHLGRGVNALAFCSPEVQIFGQVRRDTVKEIVSLES